MNQSLNPTRLERHYRRIMRIYPAWYRRERGDEIVTTLMDIAEERGIASKREGLGLVLTGMRRRLAASSVPIGLAAGMVAVFTAMLGAIAGSLIGWQTSAGLPDANTADEIAYAAIPDEEIKKGGDDHDYLFGWEEFEDQSQTTLFMGGDDYRAGFRARGLEHPADDYDLLHQAHDNLATAGWKVSEVVIDVGRESGEFTADRGDVSLVVETFTSSSYDPDAVSEDTSATSVTIRNGQPWSVPVLTIAGLIGGALLGWLVVVAVGRRVSSWSFRWKLAVAAPLSLSAIAFAAPMLMCATMMGFYLSELSDFEPFWVGFIHPLTARLGFAGAGLLAITILMVAIGWRLDSVTARRQNLSPAEVPLT